MNISARLYLDSGDANTYAVPGESPCRQLVGHCHFEPIICMDKHVHAQVLLNWLKIQQWELVPKHGKRNTSAIEKPESL